MKKYRVLVVDDDALLRNAVRRRLERKSFEVLTAQDGQEALQRLEDERVDAIITDVDMPIMNGINFVRELRNGGDMTTPVVVWSGNAGNQYFFEEMLRDGRVQRFMRKPEEATTLHQVLAELIQAAAE